MMAQVGASVWVLQSNVLGLTNFEMTTFLQFSDTHRRIAAVLKAVAKDRKLLAEAAAFVSELHPRLDRMVGALKSRHDDRQVAVCCTG
jgi:hypothetical protein